MSDFVPIGDKVAKLEAEIERMKEENEAIKTEGWRSCIDHIIKPDSPCPICVASGDACEYEHQISTLKIDAIADASALRIANERISSLLAELGGGAGNE